MSDKKNKKPQQPGQVVQLPSRCPVDSCGKKAQRSKFCNEHFFWFKEGLVNKSGEKPKDFDKKYQAFLHRKAG